MIIKLDHITYASNLEGYPSLKEDLEEQGYHIKFQETKKENPKNKEKLMQLPQKYFEAIYFEKQGFPSVEVLLYQTVQGHFSCISYVNKEELEFYVNHVPSMFHLLQTVSGKASTPNVPAVLPIRNLLDRSTLQLKLKENTEKKQWFCDTEGFGCPTFLVNSCQKTKAKLEEQGFHPTKIEAITMNEKELDIFFVSNETGDFIEIISLYTQ